VWILLLANIIKYPFFEFAPRYAAATNKSLIEGYRITGNWAVWLYTILTASTMFAIVGAVTIVTAGIASFIFHSSLSLAAISAIILGTTMAILMIGHYSALDKIIKVVIAILGITTIMAVISAFRGDMTGIAEHTISFDWMRRTDIIFLIAFIGWMPAPIDVSVWQSLWTVAKNRDLGFKPSMKATMLDFRIGYFGTALLALAFLSLGALVMYGTGEVFSSRGTVFAGQLISMYTNSIGDWAYYIIALAAFSTMFSTTLTCIDAYPRVLRPLTEYYFPALLERPGNRQVLYWFWITVMVAAVLIIIGYLSSSMRFLVDLATTLSFITAPVLAYLNYRAVTHPHVPQASRPGKWMRLYAWAGIIFLGAFSLFYIIWRLML
jgi:Mn2+/Fe2+ NRAMP family transporter